MEHFLIITLQIALCYILSCYGLATPFISSGVTLFLATKFDLSPELTFLFIIFSYFSCFLSNNLSDINQLLLHSNFSLSHSFSFTPKTLSFFQSHLLKALLFFLFLIFPIPKPPFYFTGFFAFIFLFFLIWFRNPDDNPFLGLFSFFLIWLSLFFFTFFLPISPVMGIVSGIAMTNIVLGTSTPNRDLIEYSATPPDPISAILALISTWITPGFSLSTSIHAWVNPGPWQPILGSFYSLILEAWNLGLLCRGELSTKSPLASLLTSPSRITLSPIIDTLSLDTSILPSVLLFVSFSFLLSSLLPSPSPKPLFLLFSLSCQAFLFLGPSSLLLLPLGCSFSLLLRYFLPSCPHSHSLTILLSMLL